MAHGNLAGAPGEDGYHNFLLKEHLDGEDAADAWHERVRERAAELQAEDPDLEADEARDIAAERLRREDEEAAEDAAITAWENRYEL